MFIMSQSQQQNGCIGVRNAFRFRRDSVRRRGLTLIELVIVIAILTVLGGLVVQTFPNLMRRTHISKCSDTISALNRTWGESFALNMRYPDRYDSLLTPAGAKYARLSPALGDLITPTALTATESAALAKIGVRNVVDLDPTAADATYDSAPLTALKRTIASGNVALLPLPVGSASDDWNENPLRLKRHLETDDTVKYVVFGIGSNSTAVGSGRLLQEAPTYFAESDSVNPNQIYQRYLAVFSISTTTGGESTAAFEAIAGNGEEVPSSAEAHIREFYEDRTKDQ